MLCNIVVSKLSAYHDSELTGREMLAIRAHLNDCPVCAEESTMYLAIQELLADSSIPEPSTDFEERLVTAVLGSEIHSVSRPKVGLRTALALAASLAACAFLTANFFQSRAPVPENVAVKDAIQQDQAFVTSSDPLNGVPMVVPPAYANR